MGDRGYSRRDALKAGLLGVAALSLARALPGWAQPAGPIITKVIPSTGERLPVIGLGANAYSVSSPADLAQRREVLAALPNLGGAVVDTAQSYGRSEPVIGAMVAELGIRDRLFIATKTPMGGDSAPVQEIIERSFKALRVDRIDLMQVHNLYRIDELMPALRRAKDAGRIRYLGVSTSALQYTQLLAAMRQHPLDFIQVDYSLGNRQVAERALALAQERRIAVMVSEPFGGRQRAGNVFGLLAGQRLPEWAAEIGATSWAQVLLKYAASHPATTVVIPGTTRLKHLQDNLGALQGRLPDAALRRRMEQFWDGLRNSG